MKYQFSLIGVNPLLMHRDDVEAADVLDAWRKDPANKVSSKAGDDRSPAWTWSTYLYSDGTHVAMPQDNIMAALRHAGSAVSGGGRTTLKAKSQTALVIPDEFCTFTTGGKQISMGDIAALRGMDFTSQSSKCRELGFRLFLKRAKIGQAKHVRVRPRFDEWRVDGVIEVARYGDTDEISFEQLKLLFELAGRTAGLCDWRPSSKQSPGPYGQFRTELKKK